MQKETEEAKIFDAQRAALLKGLKSKNGVTSLAIKNVYGPHAMVVLRELVEPKAPQPGDSQRARRRATFYGATATTALPSRAEFLAVLNKKCTTTARALLENAYSTLADLASEAREVSDNLEASNLGRTQRGETFTETADVLEGISMPKLPDVFDEVEIVRLPTISNATGRAHRLSEAVSDMQLAQEEVESWLDDRKQSGADLTEDEDEKEEIDESEIEDVLKEIREHADDAERVEFPGMFG